jgi:hypothetical protein
MESIRNAMIDSDAILEERGQIPDSVVEQVINEMAAEENS